MNINNKILSFFIAIFFAVNVAHSQDIHFTQFYASPLTLNPALTGNFDGDWRVTGIYRNQWRSIGGYPYATFGVGYDRPVRIYSEQLNWGIVFVNDQSGIVNLNTNRIYGNFSYLKNKGRSTFAIGVQPGYVIEGYDISKYSFDSQFDLGNDQDMFNRNNLPNEQLKDAISFIDVNAGATYSYKVSNGFIPQIGYTILHINRPNRSFMSSKKDTTHFGIRNVLHAGFTIGLGEGARLKPNFLNMMEKGASEFLGGTNLELDISDKTFKTIYFGTMLRYGWNGTLDASSWIAGLKWKNFDVGFSYDVNVSGLKTATNKRGAWEVSLIYISRSTKPTQIKIPCDRL